MRARTVYWISDDNDKMSIYNLETKKEIKATIKIPLTGDFYNIIAIIYPDDPKQDMKEFQDLLKEKGVYNEKLQWEPNRLIRIMNVDYNKLYKGSLKLNKYEQCKVVHVAKTKPAADRDDINSNAGAGAAPQRMFQPANSIDDDQPGAGPARANGMDNVDDNEEIQPGSPEFEARRAAAKV